MLREELIREAEAVATALTRSASTDEYKAALTKMSYSHERLLAFIKGQKKFCTTYNDDGEKMLPIYHYKDPETLP